MNQTRLLVTLPNSQCVSRVRQLLHAQAPGCEVLGQPGDCSQAARCRWLQALPPHQAGAVQALLSDAVAVLEQTPHVIAVDAQANILSTTDLKGALSCVNPDFIAISGFSEVELLGHNHSIVRHPDMPAQAFADLWRTLKAGRSWMGLVKSRCKNGDHYWVSAYVTPVQRNGQVVEYQSVRTQQSTAEIHAIISNLQQGTGNAVAAMGRSQQQAEASVAHARQAAQALEGINQRVGQISDMNLQIAAAVEQQSAVGDDIQRNLGGIRLASESNVVAGSQSRSSASQIAALADRL